MKKFSEIIKICMIILLVVLIILHEKNIISFSTFSIISIIQAFIVLFLYNSTKEYKNSPPLIENLDIKNHQNLYIKISILMIILIIFASLFYIFQNIVWLLLALLMLGAILILIALELRK